MLILTQHTYGFFCFTSIFVFVCLFHWQGYKRFPLFCYACVTSLYGGVSLCYTSLSHTFPLLSSVQNINPSICYTLCLLIIRTVQFAFVFFCYHIFLLAYNSNDDNYFVYFFCSVVVIILTCWFSFPVPTVRNFCNLYEKRYTLFLPPRFVWWYKHCFHSLVVVVVYVCACVLLQASIACISLPP